jgi:hypothetical protein
LSFRQSELQIDILLKWWHRTAEGQKSALLTEAFFAQSNERFFEKTELPPLGVSSIICSMKWGRTLLMARRPTEGRWKR